MSQRDLFDSDLDEGFRCPGCGVEGETDDELMLCPACETEDAEWRQEDWLDMAAKRERKREMFAEGEGS